MDQPDFSWDNAVPEIDFFGEVQPAEEKPVESTKPTPSSNDEPESPEETEEEPEIDFFGEGTTEPEQEDEKEEKPKVTAKKKDVTPETDEPEGNLTSSLGTVNFLKERGLIDFELEEGVELNDENAEEILEEAFEESIEKRVGQILGNLPDKVKNLVKFVAAGGDENEYFSKVSQPAKGISTDLDITSEENQIKFMRYKLAGEGYDEEYIESQIEFMQDKGHLEKFATADFKKWKATAEKADEELAERQREAARISRQKAITYRKDLTKRVGEVEEINNFKFSRQDKKDLPDYMTANTVKLEDGREITPFYKDLMEAMQDKDKSLVLAKILKSGFDFKALERNIVSKATGKIKTDIQRQASTKTVTASGSSQQPKRLADYF